MGKSLNDSTRGYRIENLAVDACRVLKERGEIIHYIHAQAGRQLDSEGIDILVQLKNGLFFGLQCKSKLSPVREHFKKHPGVVYILVVGDFPRKAAMRWRTRRDVRSISDLPGVPSRMCVQILNTGSEIKRDVRNYNKIVEQAVIKVRALVVAATLDARNI